MFNRGFGCYFSEVDKVRISTLNYKEKTVKYSQNKQRLIMRNS